MVEVVGRDALRDDVKAGLGGGSFFGRNEGAGLRIFEAVVVGLWVLRGVQDGRIVINLRRPLTECVTLFNLHVVGVGLRSVSHGAGSLLGKGAEPNKATGGGDVGASESEWSYSECQKKCVGPPFGRAAAAVDF